MKNNKSFILIVALLGVVLFVGATYLVNRKTESQTFEPLRADPALLMAPHSYVTGASDAPITIVEFLDPECEACREMHPIVKRILSEYEGRIRLVIRYMPLHGNSEYASAALEEAREIGKFEDALSTLFANQPQWGSHHDPKPELIPTYLEPLGMSPQTLDKNYLLTKHRAKIMKDLDDGKKLGVRATPSFFVNGRTLFGMGYEPLKTLIEMELTSPK